MKIFFSLFVFALISTSFCLVDWNSPNVKKPNVLRGVNGGSNCVACSIIVALTEQLAIVYNTTVEESMDKLCNFLPDGLFRLTCTEAVNTFGEVVVNGIYAKETPDVICHTLGFCFTEKGQPECRIFPLPKTTIKQRVNIFRRNLGLKKINVPVVATPNICNITIFKPICDYLEKVFDTHDPAVDIDKDGYSTYKTLRGTSWRGKDCNDLKSKSRPGIRAIDSDIIEDSNCNGIFGKDPNDGIPYEEKFCGKTGQQGVAVLGDSISAHFHLPEEWFDATTISETAFHDVAFVIENEADWPELSAITGYMNTTWSVIQGPTDSIYLRMKDRNRCNHRDFQNIAVNGANTNSMLNIIKAFNRSRTDDQPVLVVYSLVGNDVCNGHPDTFNHMTKPNVFYNNVIQAMEYLDTMLPPGSHVLLTGLANGSVLYELLSERIYPIGRVKNDVKYKDMYTYLSCLQISPCNGWMTTNDTVRQMTSDYAIMLSGLVKNVTLTRTFKNFDMLYMDMITDPIFDKWRKMGGEPWQLLEPVDGFHMNQIANWLYADAMWEAIEQLKPDWLGPINPNNEQIAKVFGDQGGY